MKIFKANLDDLEEILEVQYLAFKSEAEELNNFNIEPLHQKLDEIKKEYYKGIILKGIINNKIIGSIRGYFNNNTCYIHKLFIHPDFRGLGYANQLLKFLEDYFLEKHENFRFELYTSAISNRNLKLYKNNNYKIFKKEMIMGSPFVYFEK